MLFAFHLTGQDSSLLIVVWSLLLCLSLSLPVNIDGFLCMTGLPPMLTTYQLFIKAGLKAVANISQMVESLVWSWGGWLYLSVLDRLCVTKADCH